MKGCGLRFLVTESVEILSSGLMRIRCRIFDRISIRINNVSTLVFAHPDGLALGEGGDFYHKCRCGEPMFD